MIRVLVLNAGSSSLKWTVLGDDRSLIADGNEPWSAEEGAGRAEQIRATLRQAPAFDIVGHRVVHGGLNFREAVGIDESVRRELGRLVNLDPEHMTMALAGIDAVRSAYPMLPQVAAFDTAFHASLPEAAAGYALPFEWTERWGLRRFGFHGLSVAYAVERAGELLGAPASSMIVCHLGSGCSLTAVAEGHSIDTTMGFSPLEGLMMATRSGSVDPGLLLHLQSHRGVGADELREALTHRSGLLGVSGVSGDLRKVLQAAEGGSPRARLAYERFLLNVRRALGAMTAVLGKVEAVVFTGGIGENSARVRRDAAQALAFAGLELDEERNRSNETDRLISSRGSAIRALVIRSREDLAILREVLRVHRQADKPERSPRV
jgi:acetate kinase